MVLAKLLPVHPTKEIILAHIVTEKPPHSLVKPLRGWGGQNAPEQFDADPRGSASNRQLVAESARVTNPLADRHESRAPAGEAPPPARPAQIEGPGWRGAAACLTGTNRGPWLARRRRLPHRDKSRAPAGEAPPPASPGQIEGPGWRGAAACLTGTNRGRRLARQATCHAGTNQGSRPTRRGCSPSSAMIRSGKATLSRPSQIGPLAQSQNPWPKQTKPGIRHGPSP